jgi:hypothetical protein
MQQKNQKIFIQHERLNRKRGSHRILKMLRSYSQMIDRDLILQKIYKLSYIL